MNWHQTCPHCGVVTTAYTVNLNGPMVTAFVAFAEARIRLGHPLVKGELELDNSQYGNFQKLRHFGLIEPRANRSWEMTSLGWDFLRGREPVLNPAGQFGNSTLPSGHPAWATHKVARHYIRIADVLPEAWKQRAEYAAEKAGAA